MDFTAGTLISDRYRLVRLLGSGGMAVVWAAEDVSSHELRAVKLMKDDDAEARRRFLREARAAAAVQHPNVVRIVDVLEPDDGAPVIVMELLDGESLRDRLARDGKLTLAELADIAVPVISAVGAAHALGIVHRDLKPENIFLSVRPGGERIIKVLDFGIAKLIALDGEALRSTGLTTNAVLGTPAYMAPEQVFGDTDLDHRADIWALGLILYQCLSGVLPTRGSNVGQVLKNVLAQPFEPVSRLVPDLPEEIARLVADMLQRDRSARPADLREAFHVLEPFARTAAPPFGAPAGHAPSEPGALNVISADAFRPTLRATTRPRKWRAMLAVAALGIGVAVWRCALPSQPAAARSPLAAPTARLACPILRASGVEEPAGWLGAAAAAMACERARVILGGRPDRTVVPAELLGLPRKPLDDFPDDPYGRSEARSRSIGAAQRMADAYLDGEVAKQVAGFTVALELRMPDGTTIGRATGSGRGLFEAVRAAMTPLVRPDALPRAQRLDPEIAAWSRTEDVDAALATLDVSLAMQNNAGGLGDECLRFEAIRSKVGELGPMMRWQCEYTKGLPEPPVALETSDSSPAGFATGIRIRQLIKPVDSADDLARLDALYSAATTSWSRSLLAGLVSCLVQPSDSDRAVLMALTAVAIEPKNFEGYPCDPWGQLMTMIEGDRNATRAMQAWQPWNDIGWLMQGSYEGSPENAVPPLRRAYALAPLNTLVAGTLADKLFAAGRREEARSVAVAVGLGEYPVHQLERDILLLRYRASVADFRAAIDRARGAFDVSSRDAGWVRAQRFVAAWRALEIATILDRAGALADQLIDRFLVPDPPPLEGSDAAVVTRLAAICAIASPGKSAACFQRLQALRPRLSGAITARTDDFVRGAERYARGDYAAAARAWRPLLRDAHGLDDVLPDAMANAFDRAGDGDLAEKVDIAVMQRAGELNGATLGHVRAARRAFRRGDLARARSLASEVIAAWRLADEDVPAVAEMQRLLAQLPAK